MTKICAQNLKSFIFIFGNNAKNVYVDFTLVNNEHVKLNLMSGIFKIFLNL